MFLIENLRILSASVKNMEKNASIAIDALTKTACAYSVWEREEDEEVGGKVSKDCWWHESASTTACATIEDIINGLFNFEISVDISKF